jgi:hypothetical protein
MGAVVENIHMTAEQRAEGLARLRAVFGDPDPAILRVVEQRAGIEHSAADDSQ